MDVQTCVRLQHAFFDSGRTRDVSFRMAQLRLLRRALITYEPALHRALAADLGKGSFEAYTTETGFLRASVSYAMRHLGAWAKTRRVHTPLTLFPGTSRIHYEPYGVALIIGPFNYPVQLVLEPLIGAICAGNCAILKPSEQAPHTAQVLDEMIASTFDPAYICCIQGEAEVTQALLAQPLDFVFFTGSTAVGRAVAHAAAEQLIPCVLELGGKSPALIHESARLDVAAERLMWGKLLNAGQTCVAPDYALVHRSQKQAFTDLLIAACRSFLGEDAQKSPDYGRIVNARHLARLHAIVQAERPHILYGGAVDPEDRYIAPTLIDVPHLDTPCMREELFGPLLPIVTYDTWEEALSIVRTHPKPLALYLFCEDKRVQAQVWRRVRFGGGCVNDTILHLVNPNLPFGGIGPSGLGQYHGRASFLTFSHAKSTLYRPTRIRLPLLYPPYRPGTEKLVKKLLK